MGRSEHWFIRNFRLWIWLVAMGFAFSSGTQAAGFSGPKRDLTVEFRQIEEGRDPLTGTSPGRYSAGSSATSGVSASWEAQMLQVRNGEKGTLSLMDAIPMQWVSAVQAPNGRGSAAGAAPGSASSMAGAGVQYAVSWFDAGQSLSVSPQWAGGNNPVLLEIEVQRAHVEARSGQDLPAQTRNSVATKVTVPLAQWVTIAASGRPAREGTYSSESGQQARRLLQVRVMAP